MRKRIGKPRGARRGFSLLEVVAVVLILAIAVPPTIAVLQQRTTDRVNAVNTARATVLAQGVLEHVLADAQSSAAGQGYAAFADVNTYLTTPVTGLRARLTSLTQPYQNLGMSWDVSFSVPVSSSGAATGDTAQDLFRIAIVSVQSPEASGSTFTVSVSCLVTDL